MLAPEAGGSAVMSVSGVHLLFVKEDVEATAKRLDDVADNLQSAMLATRRALSGDPAGAEEASALAVSNLQQSAASLEARIRESQTQLRAAAANLRANSSSYVSADELPS